MNKENLMYFGTHEDIPKKPHKFNFNFLGNILVYFLHPYSKYWSTRQSNAQ